MAKEIYIIYSPGRTGSHIILEAISDMYPQVGGLCNATAYWHPKSYINFNNYDSANNIAIHTHDIDKTIKDLKLNTKNTTLIVSQRRDLFKQTMSLLVAKITKEWSGKNYSDLTATPQIISVREFLNALHQFKNWRADINTDDYKKIVSIYYEDIIEYGPKHIAQVLDIEYHESKVGYIQRKSPYSYKDWISNWRELEEEFIAVSNKLNK